MLEEAKTTQKSEVEVAEDEINTMGLGNHLIALFFENLPGI